MLESDNVKLQTQETSTTRVVISDISHKEPESSTSGNVSVTGMMESNMSLQQDHDVQVQPVDNTHFSQRLV